MTGRARLAVGIWRIGTARLRVEIVLRHRRRRLEARVGRAALRLLVTARLLQFHPSAFFELRDYRAAERAAAALRVGDGRLGRRALQFLGSDVLTRVPFAPVDADILKRTHLARRTRLARRLVASRRRRRAASVLRVLTVVRIRLGRALVALLALTANTDGHQRVLVRVGLLHLAALHRLFDRPQARLDDRPRAAARRYSLHFRARLARLLEAAAVRVHVLIATPRLAFQQRRCRFRVDHFE